jgi:hypothetical protein
VLRGEPALRRPGLGAIAVILAIALSLASACAREQGPSEAPADAGLEGRAKQYLTLKQRHAWAEIYDDILAPEDRERLERKRFLKKRENAFDILGFEVLSAEEQGPEGRVRVKMEAMIPVLNPGGETSLIRKQVQDPQTWVYRDGRWYIRLEG